MADSSVRELLRHGTFRWLIGSNVMFFLAAQSQALVRGFLAFQLTGSEFALGAVSFAVALPMLLISPFGGVLADRVDRRRLILAAQGVVLISESTVLSLLLTGQLRLWHLFAAALVMGSVFPLIMPARHASVADLVGRARLGSAVALNLTGMNAARVVGPALGGLLILGDDARLAYAAGIVCHAIAWLWMLRVGPLHARGGANAASLWANLLEGFQYLGRNRLVGTLLLFGLLPMFLTLPFQHLLPAFAHKVWPVGATGLGLLSAVVGLGGVAGSLFVAWRGHAERRLRLQLGSLLGFSTLLIAFCWTPRFAPALALAFLATACASVFGTLNSTAIQLLIPDEVRGRVSSFLMMSFSLPLLGVLPVSYAARELGLQQAVSGAALLAIALAAVFVLASPTLRSMGAPRRP